MKILKSKILWGFIVILLVAGFFGYRFLFPQKTTEYLTQDVVRGTVVQTVTATGKLKSASEIMLNFKNSAKISVINVKTGDKVTKGQILAKQKANDLQASVDKARANLIQAQANLAKLKSGAISQDIAVYEVALEKAESDLDNAENDLASTKSTYSQALENKKESALSDIKSILAKADVSVQRIYDTLNYKNSPNTLIFSDPILEDVVNNNYESAKIDLSVARNDHNSASLSVTVSSINASLLSTSKALSSLALTLNNLSALLGKAITNNDLTQTELDGLKTTINTEWLTTNTSASTIQSSSQSISDAQLNYQTKVEAAENNVNTYERYLAKAQADLNYKKAPARPEDIRLYEAQILSAQADLNLSLDRLDETIIRAPIDGLVTNVEGSVGEVSSMTIPIVKLLTSNNYEVEVDIPESDITKIDIDDKVEISLDAFSSDEIFSGLITRIDPAETLIQGVIYYKVTVTFDSQQPANVANMIDRIKPGMTANVTVNTAKIDNVLIVPVRAVKEEDNIKYVEVLENNLPIRTEIELGLRGDEGKAEVKSGLREGQKVITFVRTN